MSDGSRGSQCFFEERAGVQPQTSRYRFVSGQIRNCWQVGGRQCNKMRAHAVAARAGMQNLLAAARVVVVLCIDNHDRRARIRTQIVVHACSHADALHQDQQQHDQRRPAHCAKSGESGTGAVLQHARRLADLGRRTQLH
jgi:hypothetical protein